MPRRLDEILKDLDALIAPHDTDADRAALELIREALAALHWHIITHSHQAPAL